MRSIKISGDNSKVLSIELKDIIRCIDNGYQLKWSILWLEAIGDIGKSMPDFEREIRSLEKGLVIEWKDLLELSKKIHQVIEIVLIGDSDVSKLKRYTDDEEMHSSCEYTVELVDSSYWIIHSKSDQKLNPFKDLNGSEMI